MRRDLGAHPIQLTTLLNGVADGGVLLPEFQRSFDWTDANVKSLLATVLKGWPAGSLLLMDGAPDFALRPLEGAPPRSGDVEYVVLDGQQRLTSLFHALRGFGDQVWVLDASALGASVRDVSVDELEEAIQPVERGDWESDYPLRRQAEKKLVPLGTLASPTDYFDWRDAAVDEVPAEERRSLRAHLTDTYKALLSRVHDYAFPAVVLQAKLEVEAIARIFERINRTGLRLTTFDLMVARTYTPSWNLRDEWESALVDYPLLGDFMDDGLGALQVVSLLEAEDIRQPAVLQTTPEQVRAQFRDACESLAEGYEWLVTQCGVRRPEWVPYNVMPVVLGALSAIGLLSTNSERLERWFWVSVLSQRYDTGSSTQATTDFAAIRDGAEPSYPNLKDGVLTVAGHPLAESTRRKMGPFWRGFSCAMAQGDAIDPLTGESLVSDDSDLLKDRAVLRSVFPKTGAIPGRSPVHLLVLGNFLSSKPTAKTLAGQPSAWAHSDLDEAALGSQLMPAGDQLESLLLDSSAFIANRLDRLRAFVSDQTGVTVVTV